MSEQPKDPRPRTGAVQPRPAGFDSDADANLAAVRYELEEIIKDPEERSRVLSIFEEHYSGPIPPSVVEAYGKMSPKFPEKYLKTITDESVHRRRMEARELTFQVISDVFPYVAGLLYAVMAFASGIYFMISGHPEIGGTLIGTVVVGGVVAFVARGRQPPAD